MDKGAPIQIEEEIIGEWEPQGDNWLTRKDFFVMVCTELKVQSCEPITYRHAPALTP